MWNPAECVDYVVAFFSFLLLDVVVFRFVWFPDINKVSCFFLLKSAHFCTLSGYLDVFIICPKWTFLLLCCCFWICCGLVGFMSSLSQLALRVTFVSQKAAGHVFKQTAWAASSKSPRQRRPLCCRYNNRTCFNWGCGSISENRRCDVKLPPPSHQPLGSAAARMNREDAAVLLERFRQRTSPCADSWTFFTPAFDHI